MSLILIKLILCGYLFRSVGAGSRYSFEKEVVADGLVCVHAALCCAKEGDSTGHVRMRMDAGQLKGRIFRIFGLFVDQSVLGFNITETNIGKTLP